MLKQRGLGLTLLALFAAAIAFVASGDETAVGDGSTYWLHQRGSAVPVSTVATAQTVAQYYASIRFVTVVPEEEHSVVLLHEDTNTGEVSLVFIHEAVGPSGDSTPDGTTRVTVTGVPEGAFWSVTDDPGEGYAVSDGVATAWWHWWECCTDGGAISGLGSDIDLTVEYSDYDDPTFGGGFDGIIFVDGDGDRISLDLRRPFTITNQISSKAEVLLESDVPGKGIDKAPGLQKQFNPGSKAAENAGKKK